MNLDDNMLGSSTKRNFLQQLDDLKQQQKAIDRKMLHLERESKLLGL